MNYLLLLVAILMPVIMIFLIILLVYTKKYVDNNLPAELKQSSSIKKIKKELQKIKTEFDFSNFYECNTIIVLIIILLVACLLGVITFYDYNEYINTYSYHDYRILIRSILGGIALLIVILIHIINDVKKIQVDDSNLIIKKGINTKEYSIQDLEGIKIKIHIGAKRRHAYLLLRNKGEDDYTQYNLNLFFNSQRVMALAIFINLIKQNNINKMDTITEEEIQNLVDEIFIKGAN